MAHTLVECLFLCQFPDTNVATVGCIGMCSREPLVDIEPAGRPRITYANVHPEMVPHLIGEHLLKGNIVTGWAFERMPLEGIGAASQPTS